MTLLDDLVVLAKAQASTQVDGQVGTQDPVVLSRRHGVLVIRVGTLVVKAHRPGTDPAHLRARLGIAADPRMAEILVAPHEGLHMVRDRLVTLWPAGRVVDPAHALPWQDGARLLAHLHAVPATAFTDAGHAVPPAGSTVRVARAVARLPAGGAAAEQVRRAYAALPSWVRGQGPVPPPRLPGLVHGDWHLGQLVRTPGAGWRLIDIDDLGMGDPVWDLARPAALYAAGVLPPADWEIFLGAYRACGGRAIPDEDAWPRLNLPAQVLVVQIAATCVAMAEEQGRPLGAEESAMVEACGRIAAMTISSVP